MNDNEENLLLESVKEEIYFKELFNLLLNNLRLIISLTISVSILTVFYSLSLPNIYQSKTLLNPTHPEDAVSSVFGGFGGFGFSSGLGVPPGDGRSDSLKALEKLRTLSFFEENILPNIFLPDLMALRAWDSKTNTLSYNNNYYIKSSDSWTIDNNSKTKKPSSQESFKVFQSKHLSFSKDLKNNFVTLSITHESPYIAKQWVELIVGEINSFYRQKEKLEAEKSIDYLNEQLSKAKLAEIKRALADLLKLEIQKLTLIEANDFYVYEYIDPPAVMEKKTAPSRSIICIVGAFLGLFFSIIFVCFRHYFLKDKYSQFLRTFKNFFK